MEYLNVIEENFTKADYVAYLRGYILKSLLEDKPLDIPQFKLCADKLVQMLQEDQVDEPPKNLVDQAEPLMEHKFKLGDRVIITYNDFTGTIVRLPMSGVDFPDGYVVQLDNENDGFSATQDVEGITCTGAWLAHEKCLELINEPLHQFEIGDRVVINKNKTDERTGVIIRLPTKGFDNPSAYVVELDDKDIGWIAKTSVDGVSSKNAWFTSSGNIELLEDLK